VTRNETKIAYFGPRLIRGGASTVMIHVVNGLAERGFTVHVVTSDLARATEASALNQDVQVHDLLGKHVRLVRGPFKQWIRYALILWSIRRFVRRVGIDCVLVDVKEYTYCACLLRALRLLNVPLIARCGTILSSKAAMVARPRLYLWLARIFYSRADAVVVPSRMVKSDLSVTTGIEDTDVIENCIDYDRILAASKCTDGQVAICGERFVASWVGDLVSGKGLMILMEAVKALVTERQVHREKIKVIVIGDGPCRQSYLSYLKDNDLGGVFEFVGFSENPWKYAVASNCFVATSFTDGFMLALMEAAMLGVPVIYPDKNVGAADYLRELGVGREFVSRSDSSLAEVLLQEMKVPQVRDASKVDRLVQLSASEAFVNKYESLIKDVVAQNRI